MFQFLISKLNEINYTEEALQCLMYTMNNICQALKTMDIINKYFFIKNYNCNQKYLLIFSVCPIFSNVLIDLFMKFKLSILNMLPLIKGMKTLILYSSNDSKVFRILVPKLRSLISLEPVKESESLKNKKNIF